MKDLTINIIINGETISMDAKGYDLVCYCGVNEVFHDNDDHEFEVRRIYVFPVLEDVREAMDL